jgi:hypothetical protein
MTRPGLFASSAAPHVRRQRPYRPRPELRLSVPAFYATLSDAARTTKGFRNAHARSERSGAQTFLNELLVCYGTDLRPLATPRCRM